MADWTSSPDVLEPWASGYFAGAPSCKTLSSIPSDIFTNILLMTQMQIPEDILAKFAKYPKPSSSISRHSSVQFSRSVMSDSLPPHESQYVRPPCPSPNSGVHSYSCPSSWWCHPAISSSVGPFSSYSQSLPASVFSNDSTLCMRWPKYWRSHTKLT